MGVDEGVENASLPLWKRGRTAWSDPTTFSDFVGVDYEMVDDNRNDHNEMASREACRERTIESFIIEERRGQTE